MFMIILWSLKKVYGINVKQQRRDIEFRRPTHGVVDKKPPTGGDLMVTSRAVKRRNKLD